MLEGGEDLAEAARVLLGLHLVEIDEGRDVRPNVRIRVALRLRQRRQRLLRGPNVNNGQPI